VWQVEAANEAAKYIGSECASFKLILVSESSHTVGQVIVLTEKIIYLYLSFYFK